MNSRAFTANGEGILCYEREPNAKLVDMSDLVLLFLLCQDDEMIAWGDDSDEMSRGALLSGSIRLVLLHTNCRPSEKKIVVLIGRIGSSWLQMMIRDERRNTQTA